jgi:iron complex outermembrane receptor protein
MITKTMLSLTVAAGALFAAAPALAQAEAPQAADQAVDQGGFGDIIVTAQRREQKLQDVPVSVTALSGEQLQGQGVTSTHDIAQSITGMTITESGGYVQPFIRGVGSTVTNLGEPGSAAFYIDGVYMPTVNGQLYQLANVESIQVLKGPQGTLFGRNANTGAIIITTKQPQFTPAGSFTASYGNYNSFIGSGFVTGPVTDKIAVSLAGNYDRHDGWFKNRNAAVNGLGKRVGDSKRWTVRGNVLIKATDALDITLSADAMDINDASPIILQPIDRYQGYVPGAVLPTGPYDYIGNEKIGYKVEQQGVSAKLDWDLGGIKLVSTTAYRHYENHSINYDSDTTPFRYSKIDNNDVGNNFTQELLLNSDNDSNFSWVLGAFYLRQDGKLDPLYVQSGTTLTTIAVEQITDAYAGFADGTLTLGQFELTGGIRYSYEKKVITGSLNGVQRLDHVKASWDSITPRGVIAYKPNDDMMLYGSFSKGFKSGAFNANALSPVPIDPEKVDAYEVGGKFTLGRGFTVNVAGFHYKTKDLQVQALNPITNLIELRNAASVKSKGVDLDIAFAPTRKWSIKFGASYLNAKFSRFTNAQVFLPVPGGDGRNASAIIDVTGRRNVRSPDWTLNWAVDYTIDLPGGGTLVPSGNVYYSSKFYWTVDNRISEPQHVIINANLTWNLPGERFSVAVFGRNITDELRFRNVSASAQADRRAADEPALYGVRATYKF